ncbi:MraY family glycosyltransferase [Agromyces sp. Leaf222]|uniref:MraY family glycosyltransferase n=1 Tax=Agromyces sp. Leaf222 TaxID=1735688 RepID=UPI0006F29281|nr:MraY family glycosyltransferase [Agromyces sp. Leaf222]KQM84036.1 UDP-N-acetylmuramyl pentapeptide phosphotransferase [Agromyces sp. Leaf222]
MTLFIALAIIAALVTLVGSYVVWKLSLKYRLYPKIRERDVHTRPTPRLGGIAMFVGILVAFGAAWFVSSLGPTRFANVAIIFQDPTQVLAILGAALLIVLIGVADDIWDLDWTTKLAGQFIAAGLIAWQGVSIVSLPIGGILVGSSWMFATLTVFVIVLVMNAVNFIDGLDGLVAGVSLISNGVFFVYTYLLVQQTSPTNYFNLASMIAIILVGACAGFLPLNWRPAKLFMGDAGALLVGLLMATSAIAVTGQLNPAGVGFNQLFAAFIPIILPVIVLLIPLLDFGLAVVRRLRAGKSPFAADRKHLHHRLLDMGHSHLNAVLIFYSWTAVASIGCLLTYVFPVYLGISARWAFLLLGVGFVACAIVTLAPLGRRKRLTVAAEATSAVPVAPHLDELERGATASESVIDEGGRVDAAMTTDAAAAPAPAATAGSAQAASVQSGDPRLEPDERRTT